jgi:hypothetical protein
MCSQACIYIIWFVLGLVFVTSDPVCQMRLILVWLINRDVYVIMITLCNVTKSDCAVYTHTPYLVLEPVPVRCCVQITKSSQVK